MRELTVMWFLLLLLVVIVGFYVGFAADVEAFTGAVSRVARELITGVGGQDIYASGNTSSGNYTSPSSTGIVNV